MIGNGVNKPRGFMTYLGTGTTVHPGGEPATVPTGNANSITGDGFIDLVTSVPAPYHANGTFLMSSITLGACRKLKDGQGNYLWQPAYIAGQPQTLLGYPVAIDESLPSVAANNIVAAFGDWRRFYVINDRIGTSVLRDPYTNKPFVNFYTRKRVGGGVLDPKAVSLLRVAAG